MASLVAHRGASALAHENTIEAFELAIRLHADCIEFDVHRTQDGVLIVHHNDDIDGALIGDLKYSDIASDRRYAHIPTLQQTLERVAGRAKLYVEIKHAGFEQQVIDVVQSYVSNEEFVIISFLDEVILAVKNYAPDVRAGLLLVQRINDRLVIGVGDIFPFRRIRASRADFIAPRCIPVMATAVICAYWHDIPLYVWTVNSPRKYRLLSRLKKVETIASDIPPSMLPHLL